MPTDPDSPTLPDVPAAPGFPEAVRPACVGGFLTVLPPAELTHGAERYVLEQLHARGGLGQIWIARDQTLGREVAYKEVLPQWAEHQQVWSRFLREAQITGRLEHPGIVPVYELSTSPGSGQPFYTMRLVRGRTLTAAIAQYQSLVESGADASLDLRTLLGAVVNVANAVAYAHSKGVIHRDLKGDNVIIGDFGEVILLDWGIAKVLDQPDELGTPTPPRNDAPEVTGAGQVLGTPAFMSPEQALGQTEKVGPLSDVYGLGAILYQVLTGQPPFTGRDTAEVLDRVVRDPVRPPRSLQPQTPPPLAAICLKALEKEPQNRYASAVAFADDLRSFLADEPITALREPPLRRAARWGRRHRSWVAGGAALVLTALIALSLGTVMLRRKQFEIEQQRSKAEENFKLARGAVEQYLTRVADSPELKAKGLEILRRQLFGAAKGFYEQFAARRGADPAAQADLAEADTALAGINQETGQDREAGELYIKAIDLFDRLAREQPQALSHRVRLCETLASFAQHYEVTGQAPAAEATFRKASAMESRFHGEETNSPAVLKALAAAHDQFGILLSNAGRLAEAESEYKRGLTFRTRLLKLAPGDETVQSALVNSDVNLIKLYATSGRLDETRPYVNQALDFSERVVNAHPDQPLLQHKLAATLNNLAGVCVLDGRLAEAHRAYQRSLAIRERLVQEHPSVREYQSSRIVSLINLGELAAREARNQEAVERLDQALAALETQLVQEPKNPTLRFSAAYAYSWRARGLAQLGRTREARESWDQARSLNDPKDPGIRSGWCLFQARQGESQSVLAEVQDIASASRLPEEALLEAAQACAQVAAKHPTDSVLSSKALDQAMTLLTRLAGNGYFSKSNHWDSVHSDPLFQPLAGRSAFLRIGSHNEPPRGNSPAPEQRK